MNKYFIGIFLFLLFLGQSVNAQEDRIKALRDSLRLAKTDSSKWLFKVQIADAIFKTDTAKGFAEFRRLATTPEFNSSGVNQFYYYKYLAANHYELGDYIQYILDLELLESMSSALSKNEREKFLAGLIGDKGAAYANMNEPELAQKSYLESITLAKQIKNAELVLAGNYLNLAFLFMDVQEWQQAYQYLKECDQLSRNSKKTLGYITFINRSRLVAVCAIMKKNKEAKLLLNETEKLLPSTYYDFEKVYFYNAKAELAFAENKTNEALKYHKTALKLANNWKDPYYITDELQGVGSAYQRLKQIDSASKYYTLALELAQKHNYMPKVRLALRSVAEMYEQIGDFKMANEYRKKWGDYNETFIKKQNQSRIQLNEARFRSSEKQEKINVLEQQNQLRELQIKQRNYLLIALIVSVLGVSLLAFLYFKNYKKEKLLAEQNNEIQQQKIKELEQEKQLISMNSILKGQEEERSRMAKDLHDGLGSMLSGIKLNLSAMHQNFIIHSSDVFSFEKALTQLDSAIVEMRRVAHNMMPEALLKFGLHEAIQDYCDSINESGTLKMQFTAIGDSKSLDATVQKVLYRIFQELTNNAIKHAAAQTIFIQISHHEKGITLTVEDDGKGFDTSKTNGAGLSNVKSRVDYLKGTLHIDTSPENGTSITVEIPTS